MGLSHADAADVCQATWLTLFQHVELIRKPGSIPSWIITTASREAWKLRRANNDREHKEAHGGRGPEASSTDLPSEVIERLEKTQIVRDGIEELDARCHRLLGELYLNDPPKSYQEVADALGMPLGSIGPVRIRCLAKLAGILERTGLAGPGPA